MRNFHTWLSQYLAFAMNFSHSFGGTQLFTLVVTGVTIFTVSYLSPRRRLIGHWHPGPGALSTGPRVSALYRCTPGATCTALYSYRHCTTVHHPHTRRSSSSCGGMQGGDVFEFIINCMSLLNIAHARHCPHRSRWLPWPGARIISTKTVRAGDAEDRANSDTKYKVWDESLSGDGCGGIFLCCGKYLFVV